MPYKIRIAAMVGVMLAVAGVLLAIGLIGNSEPAHATVAVNLQHGISIAGGCDNPVRRGDPFTCALSIFNNVDQAHDTLTITSLVDVVHAFPTDVLSGNILPTLTLTASGGATCNVGQTVCTLPFGSSLASNSFSIYSPDGDDPSPLQTEATLTWHDLCDGTPTTNCNANPPSVGAGSQAFLVNAEISIGPNATNLVGVPHTFTVTLEKDQGDGNGFVPAAGEHVDVSLTDALGATHTAPTGSCTIAGPNTDASGQCTITFTSNTAGTVTGHAKSTLSAGGLGITVQTDGVSPNSGDPIKTFVNTTISPPDLAALVKQLLDDENRGDLAAVLAAFIDDAVIDGLGACAQAPCVGKAAIQKDDESSEAAHSEHVLADSTFQVSGNAVTARIEHTNDASRAAGVDRFFVIATYEFTGTKISHISRKLDTSDAQTAKFAAFQKAKSAGQLPTTGGEPSSSDGAGLLLFWLLPIGLVIAGGFSTALGLRRRG